MVLVLIAHSIWLCERTSRDLGVHDHGGIVWDEFVGFWLTMVAAPEGWHWLLAGFLLFRLFDILKPFPINYLDRHIHGGLGIMLDDAVAGSFAWFCLQAAHLAL
jgi:phosphatidylglycerophosphatase A